jgi:hypothetical protein
MRCGATRDIPSLVENRKVSMPDLHSITNIKREGDSQLWTLKSEQSIRSDPFDPSLERLPTLLEKRLFVDLVRNQKE